MVKGFYKDLTDLLKKEADAYYWEPGKGSHEKWRLPNGQVIIIPRNCMSANTANGILKDAGLAKRF